MSSHFLFVLFFKLSISTKQEGKSNNNANRLSVLKKKLTIYKTNYQQNKKQGVEMIITVTGKPCSGKGTVAKEFCKNYGFEYVCTGDMFRTLAKEMGYENILAFQQQNKNIKEVDKIVDERIINLGKTRQNENIVIDSRLAWHFVPNSFKVFIDVDDKVAGERLISANRETENVKSLEQAIKDLQVRWNVENNRYMELYNINNLDLNNYDFVIDSSNLEPNQVVKKIYTAYKNFIKQ